MISIAYFFFYIIFFSFFLCARALYWNCCSLFAGFFLLEGRLLNEWHDEEWIRSHYILFILSFFLSRVDGLHTCLSFSSDRYWDH